MTRSLPPALVAGALSLGLACEPPPASVEEAAQALKEAFVTSAISGLSYEPIEITTSFTLGQAAADAAAELHAFLESQLPCAEIGLEGHILTIDHGELGDACVFRGNTYAGFHQVTLVEVGAEGAVVEHLFKSLTNGVVMLDGEATVTWDAGEASRRVEHRFTWHDGTLALAANGDRTQRLLAPEEGLAGGIVVDGWRAWITDDWTVDLGIEGVELRGQDPVPQAGAYRLGLPGRRDLLASFERVDADTLQVTLAGLRREHVWLVHRDGTILDR